MFSNFYTPPWRNRLRDYLESQFWHPLKKSRNLCVFHYFHNPSSVFNTICELSIFLLMFDAKSGLLNIFLRTLHVVFIPFLIVTKIKTRIMNKFKMFSTFCAPRWRNGLRDYPMRGSRGVLASLKKKIVRFYCITIPPISI